MFADVMLVVVESCARASVVLCAAWGVTAMMRHASAATRHFVWSCAIAGAIVASALGSVGPRWSLTVPASIASAPTILTEKPSAGIPALGAPAASIDVSEITITTPASSPAPVSQPAIDPAFALGLAWVAGVLAVLAYVFSGAVGAWLLRRSATPVHVPWVEEAQTLAEVFEIPGVITVAESKAIAMPMVCGIWRPLIVVPPSAHEWSDERRRVVVIHELAHIKRRDCLTQAIAQVVCAIYWFNPIVWLAARRLRVERERACDDFVLAAGEKGADYAAHLLDIAQTMRHSRALAVAGVAMARPSQLEGRLLAILNPAIRRSSALYTRLASMALVLAVTLPVGAVEFIGAPHSEASTVATVAPATTETLAEIAQPSVSQSPSPAPAPSPSPAPKPQVAQPPAGQTSQARTTADSQTIEALIGALNDSDADVRQMVVTTLSRMRDPRIVTALLPLLKDSSADVRQQVVFALSRSGDARAVTAVAGMVDDASADVRQQAVHLLGRSRNPDALPALTKALKDSSPDVRQQAAFGLGQLRNPNSVDALIDAIRDSDADVRQQAAFALGHLRDPKALPALTAALRDPVADVRQQAAFAIGQISKQQ